MSDYELQPDERRAIAAFLKAVIGEDRHSSPPAMALLDSVSLPGLQWMVHSYTEALGSNPLDMPTTRQECYTALGGLMNLELPPAENSRAVTFASTHASAENSSTSALRVHKGRKPYTAPPIIPEKPIEPRTRAPKVVMEERPVSLNMLRALNDWKRLTGFLGEEGYAEYTNALADFLHRRGVKHYRNEHGAASEEEAAAWAEKEYFSEEISHWQDRKLSHPRHQAGKYTLYNLSPLAQTHAREWLSAHALKKNEYTNVRNRPGWKMLEQSIGLASREYATPIADNMRQEKIDLLAMGPMSMTEAEQQVDDNYFWSYRATDGKVYRVLSEEAQSDLKQKLQQELALQYSHAAIPHIERLRWAAWVNTGESYNERPKQQIKELRKGGWVNVNEVVIDNTKHRNVAMAFLEKRVTEKIADYKATHAEATDQELAGYIGRDYLRTFGAMRPKIFIAEQAQAELHEAMHQVFPRTYPAQRGHSPNGSAAQR